MYLDFKVKIPAVAGKITFKNIKGTEYVYYEYNRKYIPERRYNQPVRAAIGKRCQDQPEMMIPNGTYLKYFPEAELPEDRMDSSRSGCLRIGAYLVIKKVIAGYHLDEIMDRIIGRDGGLFLDLAAYSIITENNAGQYYPDYAYNHPLFTEDMRVYSDSKVSEFLGKVLVDQRLAFLDEWNDSRDHREKIYVSYDSTNKHCQAGDIELAEFGHEKDKQDKPIYNYSIAYDRSNQEPLFLKSTREALMMYPSSNTCWKRQGDMGTGRSASSLTGGISASPTYTTWTNAVMTLS